MEFNKKKIAEWVQIQKEIGLDVLVHGEFERNDMVEYFGEQLSGYLFTEKAWVQSYGTRCVKPPVIWGGCIPRKADDRGLVRLCTEPDKEADEGHADRSGYDFKLVFPA